MSIGTSLSECTARSARPSSIAISSSLMKRPLPPMSASAWSSTRSPWVVIPSSSTSHDGYNSPSRALTCVACHIASADSRVAITSRRGPVTGMREAMGSKGEKGAMVDAARAALSRRRLLRWILASGAIVPWLVRAQTAPVGDGTEIDEFSMEAVPPAAKPPKLPRVNGHAVNLPAARALNADGERSARERIPVLLFFDLWDCPYCDRAL